MLDKQIRTHFYFKRTYFSKVMSIHQNVRAHSSSLVSLPGLGMS